MNPQLVMPFVCGVWLLIAPTLHAIVDTNDNGVSDIWEKQYNNNQLYPESFDTQSDPDMDGWTNAQEAAAGTDPSNPNSPDGLVVPEIRQTPAVMGEEDGEPVILTPEAVTVSWLTLVGKQYTFLFSPDLDEENWIAVEEPFIGDGSIQEFNITIPGSNDKRFWRIAVTDTDTDGDSLTNAEEHSIGSSPFLADTNRDGMSDAEAYASGGNPSSTTPDANGDGVPDSEIYSIIMESLSEYNNLEVLPWHTVLTGEDDTKRYLTKVDSEIYTVSGSPRYQSISDAAYSVTESCQSGTGALEVQPPKFEGVPLSSWLTDHGIALGQGESIEWGTSQTTETQIPPTVDLTGTTKTTTQPWTLKKDGNVIGSGTETIVEIKRTELFHSITVQQLWSRFKSRSWDEDQNGWNQAGPPGGIATADLDAQTAEWIRQRYESNESPLFDWLSWPEQDAGRCGDRRIKAMRWRWVKFNPQSPGQYQYAAPPAGYSRSFHFLVMKWDRDLKSGEWPDSGQGLVELRCEGGTNATGWQNVDMSLFSSHRQQDPWKIATMNFTSSGRTQVFIQGVSAGLQKRMPVIAEADDQATTYRFEPVMAVPRELPLPGVEIYRKDLAEGQLVLSGRIYDPVSDVLGSCAPVGWVNSRIVELGAGDKPGVYRLKDHSYKLFPGRNEITLVVENALGARAYETIVVEGDESIGYALIGEPVRVPAHPTCPVVFGAPGENSTQVTVSVGTKSVQLGFEEQWPGPFGEWWYRTKPMLAALKPPSATESMIGALPAGKPLFLTELENNVAISASFPGASAPSVLSLPQSGLELTSPGAVEIAETTETHPTLSFKARKMGAVPFVMSSLTTYQGDEAVEDASNKLLTSYQAAYGATADADKDKAVSFDVTDLAFKEGYNGLAYSFGKSPFFNHHGRHESFRFPAPTKAGIRVFSGNRKRDSVLDGVTGRMGDIWYPVDADADFSELADSLEVGGCHVVGMAEMSGCFDDFPLKRSVLVRGLPGRAFQAFDQLYAMQGRTQRSQTFDADGTHGVALASEMNRVQTDEDLPASAKNALALEIAGTYQFHNGFEDFVPKTHQSYIDPGNGTTQPNSWTMRGNSLPDHPQSNPCPWTVTSTLSEPARSLSAFGVVKLNTTAENSAYYATTSANAPWDLDGARAVALRFKLLEHDATNGTDGAFQLAAGDGSRTWTCQVAPSQIKVQGTTITLPAAVFPSGLIDGKFHTLQFNFSGTGNDALVSIDGEVLSATATAQAGTLNGIAFGDPGAGIAGKFEVDILGFENSELRYQYGCVTEDYADSDEVTGGNNILLYLRSKGQAFRTSPIARWVRILDPNVHEWLLEKYTTKRNDGATQELQVIANRDVWLGSTVSMDVSTDYGSVFNLWDSKVSNTLVLDREETKVWSSDQTRNEMQLAGILMAWCYEQDSYKVWLAEKEGDRTGVDGILIEKKHLVENIAKCAKRVETTLEVGGEIAISMTNEFADYAITIKDISQGEYMAMVGFIPLVPSSTARVFKFMDEAAEAGDEVIEEIHQLSTRLDDFPSGMRQYTDPYQKKWMLDFDNIFANADDADAVLRARKLTTDELVSDGWTGKRLLSTFSNSSVTVFKTLAPIKAYRVYGTDKIGSVKSNFFMFEKPISKTQAEVDYALGSLKNGMQTPFQNYDRVVEVEIPSGVYVYMGIAGKQTERYRGGGTQFWLSDEVIDDSTLFDWNLIEASGDILPQF